MKKLLITGASGFLGWNLCKEASATWQVYGVCHTHPLYVENVISTTSNLTDYAELKKLFCDIRPDAVIHAAATSDPNYCQLHPTETHKINVTAAANIAGLCSDIRIPCVFTSTDLVFDGLHPPYAEENPVTPICIYGEQKAEACVSVPNWFLLCAN